jgi:hypothetical protein
MGHASSPESTSVDAAQQAAWKRLWQILLAPAPHQAGEKGESANQFEQKGEAD